MGSRSVLIVITAILVLLPMDSRASHILFGGVGRGSTEGTPGSLVIVDQNTAAGTFVGHPDGVAGINGLAFDSTGALFATVISAIFGSTSLIVIDPDTGAQVGSAVPTTFQGAPITINDLAVQPGTDVLFGTTAHITAPASQLFTIDKTTGVATLVGDLPSELPSGGIAFGPDGTLFHAFQDFVPPESVVVGIQTLDPTDASVISTALTPRLFFRGLAARSDGVLFGSTGRFGDEIWAIDPVTIDPLVMTLTLVGNQNIGSVGDLAFGPSEVVPVPPSILLMAVGVAGLGRALRRRASTTAAALTGRS